MLHDHNLLNKLHVTSPYGIELEFIIELIMQ